MLYKNFIVWVANYYSELQTLLNNIEEHLYCIRRYNHDTWIIYNIYNPLIQFQLIVPSFYFTIVKCSQNSYFVAKVHNNPFYVYEYFKQHYYLNFYNILNNYTKILNAFKNKFNKFTVVNNK